jgi:putative transposase
MVHWYRNVISMTPRGKVKEVMAMLKAIHAQEDRRAAREKAALVTDKLEAMRLGQAAKIVRDGVEETLSYMAFARKHWTRVRTNNVLERIMRETPSHACLGNFPNGQSAVMLVAARLRHIAGTRWGKRVYLDMQRLSEVKQSAVKWRSRKLGEFFVTPRGNTSDEDNQFQALPQINVRTLTDTTTTLPCGVS